MCVCVCVCVVVLGVGNAIVFRREPVVPREGERGKTKPPDDSGRLGGALVDPTTRADYEFDSEDAVAFILPDVVQEC